MVLTGNQTIKTMVGDESYSLHAAPIQSNPLSLVPQPRTVPDVSSTSDHLPDVADQVLYLFFFLWVNSLLGNMNMCFLFNGSLSKSKSELRHTHQDLYVL